MGSAAYIVGYGWSEVALQFVCRCLTNYSFCCPSDWSIRTVERAYRLWISMHCWLKLEGGSLMRAGVGWLGTAIAQRRRSGGKLLSPPKLFLCGAHCARVSIFSAPNFGGSGAMTTPPNGTSSAENVGRPESEVGVNKWWAFHTRSDKSNPETKSFQNSARWGDLKEALLMRPLWV